MSADPSGRIAAWSCAPGHNARLFEERRPLDRRIVWLLLGLATLAAAALRLPFLGHQSLWFDEIYTRDIIGQASLGGLWHQVRATESTPPLYYVVGWIAGGRSPVAMRAIPAVALITSVPCSYFAVRRLVGQRAALATASILAVSPILVSYATDARSYGLFVLTSLLSVWALSALLERGSQRGYALWVAASVACVWTHYFGALLVGAELLVLLATRRESRLRTIAWGALLAACLAPLVPLATSQSGDERAAFISGQSLSSRVATTVRQLAMGPNVPRSWLEGIGLLMFGVAVAMGVLLALRPATGPRIVLVLVAGTLLTPLLLAVLGIEDRFYARNVIACEPLLAALAAGPMLKAHSVPLAAYLAIAALTSGWVASDWRYEQLDWRGALARADQIDPHPAVVAVTKFSVPVVRTYLGREPAPAGVVAERAWIVLEPVRAAAHRALGPTSAPAPTIPGFALTRRLEWHGFTLELATAARPTRIASNPAPEATVFPGR